MEKEFVTYEIALKLTELGFGIPCCAYYGNMKVLYGNFWSGNAIEMGLPDNSKHVVCYAPLWQQVIDWLMEKHNIYMSFDLKDPKYINVKIHNVVDMYTKESFHTAREKAIITALEEVETRKTTGKKCLKTNELPKYNCSNCIHFIAKNKTILDDKQGGYAKECSNLVHPLEDCILKGFKCHSEK